MSLTKVVNGETVDMSPEEEAAILADWAVADPDALENRRVGKLAQVYAKSGSVFEKGFSFDFGKTGVRRLDCRSADDKVNWLLLLIQVRELIAAKVTDDVPLIDADNNIFAAPPEIVEAALIAMRLWGAKSIFTARRIKDAVLAAPDPDALAKIDIDAALAAAAVAEPTP